MTRWEDARTGKGAGIVRFCPPNDERQADIDGEQNGNQEATQGTENAQNEGQEQQETQQQDRQQVEGSNTPDYERQIAERDERIDFKLQLAGVRNVKAARALLADHDNDVDKLKEAEPWLFAKHADGGGKSGKTGLPNAGAASDAGKTMQHWREIAGLTDSDDKKE